MAQREPAAIVAWFEVPPQHFKSTFGSERTGCTLSRPFLRNPEEEQDCCHWKCLGCGPTMSGERRPVIWPLPQAC